MPADIFIIAVVLVLGITAFVFGIVHAVWRGLGFVARSVFGRRTATADGVGRKRLVCPSDACRKVEYRDATYCSQCGARLVERGT